MRSLEFKPTLHKGVCAAELFLLNWDTVFLHHKGEYRPALPTKLR